MTVGLSVDSENIFLVKTETVVLFLSTKQRAIYQNEHKKINLLDTCTNEVTKFVENSGFEIRKKKVLK